MPARRSQPRHHSEEFAMSNPQRVREAVLAMPMARTLQLDIRQLEAGSSEIHMPVLDSFCFRPSQLQATAVFAIADFAAVSAAGTLLPDGWINATIDGTLKLLAPARGKHLRACGRVVDPGRLLTICAAEVYAVDDNGETLCATLLGTARNIDPTTRH